MKKVFIHTITLTIGVDSTNCELPPKESFYSELTTTHISDQDYERANIVWDNFNIHDVWEPHDLYFATYVLLLTDVFERFKDMCLDYGLDLAHYYT